VLCNVIFAEAQRPTDFSHVISQEDSHGVKNVAPHGDPFATDDNDQKDEWGTPSEKLALIMKTPQDRLIDKGYEYYNKGMSYEEGNIAFKTKNPSTGAVGGTGVFTITATQSSTLAGSPAADVAIDGQTDQLPGSQTCTHTQETTDPWWKVDLGEVRTVTEVRLFNMGGHPKYRMDNIEVFVGDGSTFTDATRCGQYMTQTTPDIHKQGLKQKENILDEGGMLRVACPSLGAGLSTAVQPTTLLQQKNYVRGGGKSGKFVTVRVKGVKKVLHLCEVQIMGSLGHAPTMFQGTSPPQGDLGDGVPIDPCSMDVRSHSSHTTRLCPDT